jgi:hypothetical protein
MRRAELATGALRTFWLYYVRASPWVTALIEPKLAAHSLRGACGMSVAAQLGTCLLALTLSASCSDERRVTADETTLEAAVSHEPDARAPQPADAGPFAPEAAMPQRSDAGPPAAADSGAPPPRPVVFKPRLQGEYVLIDRPPGRALFIMTCNNAVLLEKQSGAGWAPLRDARNGGWNGPGYYFDDVYFPPTPNPGCDFSYCSSVSDAINAGAALEYLEQGSRPGPVADGGTPPWVPDIKSQALEGKLRVSLRYSLNPQCGEMQSVQLELDVPKGVCCPPGNPAVCDGSRVVGGWAASLDTCFQWVLQDGYASLSKDAHGCPMLKGSTSAGDHCCGCPASTRP